MNTATATTSSSANPPGMVSPMVRPAPYSGRAEECNGFLLQCSLTFEMQPHLFPTERAKIAFIISLLHGKLHGKLFNGRKQSGAKLARLPNP